MNAPLKRTLVTDRLVEFFCSPEQIESHSKWDLQELVLREILRLELFADFAEHAVVPRLDNTDFSCPLQYFKVLERGLTAPLTPEQAQGLEDIQKLCAAPIPRFPRGLQVSRAAGAVEKVVVVQGKEVKLLPCALLTIVITDPQGRSAPFYVTRRLGL